MYQISQGFSLQMRAGELQWFAWERTCKGRGRVIGAVRRHRNIIFAVDKRPRRTGLYIGNDATTPLIRQSVRKDVYVISILTS